MRTVIYKSDVEIRYACGCSESRLEAPEYWEKKCSAHRHKYRYKIGVLVRCMEWAEVVYADSLPEAISKVTDKLLKDEPNLKSWKTRLISELHLPTMKYLRRGDGKFD